LIDRCRTNANYFNCLAKQAFGVVNSVSSDHTPTVPPQESLAAVGILYDLCAICKYTVCMLKPASAKQKGKLGEDYVRSVFHRHNILTDTPKGSGSGLDKGDLDVLLDRGNAVMPISVEVKNNKMTQLKQDWRQTTSQAATKNAIPVLCTRFPRDAFDNYLAIVSLDDLCYLLSGLQRPLTMKEQEELRQYNEMKTKNIKKFENASKLRGKRRYSKIEF